jgi:hypothetical protein
MNEIKDGSVRGPCNVFVSDISVTFQVLTSVVLKAFVLGCDAVCLGM